MRRFSAFRHRLLEGASRLLPGAAGYVDHFDIDRVAGWAVDPRGSGEPVTLSLHVDGRHMMNIRADLPRDDVAKGGRAPLRCGFDTALPTRLRDGADHLVELRLGQDGPRLRGGRLKLGAGMTGRPGSNMPVESPAEGVVWFDRSQASLSGWAIGCGFVSIAIDGAPPRPVSLDREVPGLGAGNRQGFRYRVPSQLMDGSTHDIDVRAGHWNEDVILDGSPMRLRLGPVRAQVTLEANGARRTVLVLRDRDGRPATASVRVTLDGAPISVGTPDADGRIRLDLPENTRHLVVATDPEPIDEATPSVVLGRYVIGPSGTVEEWSADLPRSELDTDPLADDLLTEARAAFDAFAAAPDSRFDADWVALAAGLEGSETALDHWRDGGARAGLAPGPAFDETAARALHPGVVRAVADGTLPAAFALELVLGAGTLGSMTGLARHQRRTIADPPSTNVPIPAELPPVTTSCRPSESIYAAWLARLEISPETRAGIAADEEAARTEVAGASLLHQPLVSIVMPTWNRAFTIGEAIQSVIEQSYPNWELLICDDASEDRTADVVRDFDDSRIRYMRFQKSNGAGARNHGLRQAAGTYIAYLDSDNMWHPLFLDLMLRRLMARPGLPIAYGAYLDTETRGARVHLSEISRPPFRPVQLSNKNFMDLNTIVHHRRVSDWLGGFDAHLPRLQDWDMALRHTSIFGAQFVDRIGVFYRRNIAWGQVTQTQMGSGAQDTVNGKTQARLAEKHERMDLAWPAPGRAVILCGPGDVDAPDLAVRFAEMAGRSGSVDLVTVGMDIETPAARVRTLPAKLLSDPQRLGAELADLLDAPVLVCGMSDDLLQQVPGLRADRVLRPVSRSTGTWLSPLANPDWAFPLGAIPLELSRNRPAGASGTVLVLGPAMALAADDWHDALRSAGLAALVPPLTHERGWRRVGADGVVDLEGAAATAALADVSASVVLRGTVATLPPAQLALLNALQACGVPTALRDDGDPEGLARQWIDARAAYELKSDAPDWIFEKIAKLQHDTQAMARLSERSHTVHRIALAPELAQERLTHALWRLQFDPPRIEMVDAR